MILDYFKENNIYFGVLCKVCLSKIYDKAQRMRSKMKCFCGVLTCFVKW